MGYVEAGMYTISCVAVPSESLKTIRLQTTHLRTQVFKRKRSQRLKLLWATA